MTLDLEKLTNWIDFQIEFGDRRFLDKAASQVPELFASILVKHRNLSTAVSTFIQYREFLPDSTLTGLQNRILSENPKMLLSSTVVEMLGVLGTNHASLCMKFASLDPHLFVLKDFLRLDNVDLDLRHSTMEKCDRCVEAYLSILEGMTSSTNGHMTLREKRRTWNVDRIRMIRFLLRNSPCTSRIERLILFTEIDRLISDGERADLNVLLRFSDDAVRNRAIQRLDELRGVREVMES